MRNSYHTTLKELIHYGLIPTQYVGEIPKANISRWKNDTNIQRYVGSEINQIADSHTELIKTLNQYPKMFYAYGRLVKTLSSIISDVEDFNHKMRAAKEKIVNAIIKTSKIIPIVKAVKIFQISTTTFYTWVADVKLRCKKSVFELCNKIYPSQITPVEIKAIKKALMNPKTRHWSIRSVHLFGIRNGTLSVSENTIYKVNKALGIRTSQNNVVKRKNRKKGIRASAPNQIWHADITTLKTADNKRYYISLVIDNFSRCILAYGVSDCISGSFSTTVLKQAYSKALEFSDNLNVDLIVDGGPENNNFYIDHFIDQSNINIQKLVALKDIQFSNSMIERVNRTLKYRYLFPKQPRDLKHLNRILGYFIHDYNTVKPHGKLKGLTPEEAWNGFHADEKHRTKLLKEARVKRIEYARNNKCEKC